MNKRIEGVAIRVRGLVQGVGFRPTVWHMANECGLDGEVWNDAEGVLIRAWGGPEQIERFVARLRNESPPLSRIEGVELQPLEEGEQPDEFSIVESRQGEVRTGIVPDAATCDACLSEVLDPANRRYRYPFTNCTHCGPRLSIVRSIPYDRATTSMSVFPQCPACQAEYDDPADRRFHAQPNACGECGSEVWLEDAAGSGIEPGEGQDAIARAAELIRQGTIVAIKGIGGVHLACDATNSDAVDRLRQRKRRYHKAFALMAGSTDMINRYARLDPAEEKLLHSPAAPIVVLEQRQDEQLAPGVAPGQNTQGFMLPYTPLHHLLMKGMQNPIVLTSGNRSDEPQCTANEESHQRLGKIADYWLLHNRDIVNRLDDSVVRMAAGAPRMLRRARGYAPAPIELPAGFSKAPPILAMGGELKNTFCLLQEGRAIVSQHMGDLEDAATHHDYRHNLALYQQLFQHAPRILAVDEHPNYLSTQLGRERATEEGLMLEVVQHHHAHIAACMAEQGVDVGSGPVLGIALDGLGFGEDGSIWGGEFLKADYLGFKRLACFEPVAMIGGAKAMYEPWRNTFAHLENALGWERVAEDFGQLELVQFLGQQPVSNMQTMMQRGLNTPLASSAGRLFDAMAAAVGICREQTSHEGQAAIELEALADRATLEDEASAYDHRLTDRDGLQVIQWQPLWQGVLEDLAAEVSTGVMAASFHGGVARAVAEKAIALCRQHQLDSVVLSGGVFQNKILLELVESRLRAQGLKVLIPELTPANDGGISLGQAAIAAARSIAESHNTISG
ncbi:carbamoyltransferase HypF [Solemya velesiana gill symbiont]|uniref:Carbamoyltransferase HypF n=1 Tax=Solemya velesiana gill symbiont TaxID=1918948 RepID=A0A1T2KSM0_9GAMM|nr:carbamoyltransferase HypF [Solemya velesiana gill symbiont]OOZ35791.1 carbamoyltransferase HypF [Solemya velesiana gill symbiont]